MLHFPRWQVILILAVVLGGFLAVVPNFFSRETLASWPGFLPRQQMVLGLDLQGGAYLLYEVDRTDYIEKRLRTLTSDVRRAMLENPRIGYTGLGVRARVCNSAFAPRRLDDAKRLEALRSRSTGFPPAGL
jgi:preprotein translocase subunit SecD/SecD/SecF fusion protein